MRIVDMHCDTLLECYLKDKRLRKNDLSVDLETMKKNRTLGQFFAIFLPLGRDAEEAGLDMDPYSLFLKISEVYKREIEANSDLIRPALSYDDVIANREEGKMSSILTVEDGQLLDGRLERLEELYERGVRLLTLTWNYENCIGYPNSREAEKHRLGLKPFGIETVERMNRLGMIVDVSHLSEGGFYDVAEHSDKPSFLRESIMRSSEKPDGRPVEAYSAGGRCGRRQLQRFVSEGTIDKDLCR